MGIQTISHLEIDSYSNACPMPLTGFERRLVRKIADKYCDVQSKKRKRTSKDKSVMTTSAEVGAFMHFLSAKQAARLSSQLKKANEAANN